MSSATRLRGVAGKAAAGAAELVVERDCGGECGESGAEAHAEIGEGPGAVAFEGEDVFAGLEDRLDPLADWREVRTLADLVFASRAHDRRVERGQLGLEFLTAEVLIALSARLVANIRPPSGGLSGGGQLP
jgi:hypothetical protein